MLFRSEAAAAADAAAVRAEGAAASAVAAARVPVAPVVGGQVVAPQGVSGPGRVAGRGAGLPEGHGGAPGRAWRLLDSDIETLD